MSYQESCKMFYISCLSFSDSPTEQGSFESFKVKGTSHEEALAFRQTTINMGNDIVLKHRGNKIGAHTTSKLEAGRLLGPVNDDAGVRLFFLLLAQLLTPYSTPYECSLALYICNRYPSIWHRSIDHSNKKFSIDYNEIYSLHKLPFPQVLSCIRKTLHLFFLHLFFSLLTYFSVEIYCLGGRVEGQNRCNFQKTKAVWRCMALFVSCPSYPVKVFIWTIAGFTLNRGKLYEKK